MKHLDQGALRRLYDDPLAVGEPERAHFATCEECSRRFDAVAADARRAAALLAVAPVAVDADAALARLRARPRSAPVLRLNRRAPWRPLAAAGIAAVALVALAVTGAAQQLITVMQPSSIQVVPVTTSELQAMPDLSQFGTVHWSGDPRVTPVSGADAAAQAAGFSAPSGNTPAGAGDPQYGVLAQTTATFTFSSARAEAWATAHNVSLPAMPAGMDGSSLELTVGPAIVEIYGASSSSGIGAPQLAFGKMRAPSLASTGPSVKTMEAYLLSIPGFPPDLAAQLRALGDPSNTLPLPVPVDRATAEQAQVNGVTATVVGDDTGLGAGAIWVKEGYVYGVAGTQTQDTILAIARSLH